MQFHRAKRRTAARAGVTSRHLIIYDSITISSYTTQARGIIIKYTTFSSEEEQITIETIRKRNLTGFTL